MLVQEFAVSLDFPVKTLKDFFTKTRQVILVARDRNLSQNWLSNKKGQGYIFILYTSGSFRYGWIQGSLRPGRFPLLSSSAFHGDGVIPRQTPLMRFEQLPAGVADSSWTDIGPMPTPETIPEDLGE